jgi:crotonobetainyl-CoA:carnitine CoA-transferase CaiB-like acyl-CoA transferase
LYWLAYNANKISITLNLESVDGREVFKRLVSLSDIVLDSFPSGYMESIGLSYEIISDINPGIVMASISPFGQEGPYGGFDATDMIVMAMGGWAYLCGEENGPPVAIGYPQSYLCASGDAASGIMAALYYREFTGQGQYIDVCAQQSVNLDLREAVPYWFMNSTVAKRASPYGGPGKRQRWLWKCSDGFVIWYALGGMAAARANHALVEWIKEEGMSSGFLEQIVWEEWDLNQATQEFFNQMETEIAPFFKSHTKTEIYEGSNRRNIVCYPVSTVEDLINNKQLQARKFWVNVEHSELGCNITYPGHFAKLSEGRLASPIRAPLIGEHNRYVYKDILGFDNADLARLKKAGAI